MCERSFRPITCCGASFSRHLFLSRLLSFSLVYRSDDFVESPLSHPLTRSLSVIVHSPEYDVSGYGKGSMVVMVIVNGKV